MHLIDTRDFPPSALVLDESRIRHQSRVPRQRAADGTYDQPVPASASQDPRVIAFARFVKRALDEAVKDRGMSIEDVEQRTGLGRSTMYRWRRAEIANPQRTQVQQFCDGLGIPRTVASQILGWDGAPPSPEPDPTTDPDLRAVARILVDPNVSAEEKTVIRATLKHLARRR